jgi:predicted ABC-type ATPase
MTLAPLREAADSLVKASTPQPFSTSKTSNWVARAGGLPDYIQHVAHGILRSGASDESSAIQKAIGVVKRWAAGGGKVDANTQAAAAKAVAEWEAKKAGNAAKGAVKESWIEEADRYVATWADERLAERDAMGRILLLEEVVGVDGLIGLLGEGVLREAAAWKPTLKRTASASNEVDRHEVYDGGQHVGTVAQRRGYGGINGKREPNQHAAFAVNGKRVTDYNCASRDDALKALQSHLEEAPARVITLPTVGKFLVADPHSYSGETSYKQFSSEQAARHSAGLPPAPTTPERDSKVEQVAEALRFDLMTVSSTEIPPLRRVQEARRADPFDLIAEAFHPDELRGFGGKWTTGGARARAAIESRPSSSASRIRSAAHQSYEGGRRNPANAATRALASKPQIPLGKLASSVGTGKWSSSALKAGKDIMAGKVADTEHAHRLVNADGSLGAYSPERQALHEQILTNMLQGKARHEGKARAIFTAGGPASGKSGLEKFGMLTLPKDVVNADPDTIRAMLPEYQQMVDAGRKDASNATHEEASHLAKVLTKLALGRQHHILVDTVGDSGPDKFAGKIRQAQRAGHEVSVHYATTDVKTAMARAKARGDKGGRYVPDQFLKDAHAEVSRRFVEDVSKIPGIHLQIVDTTARPNSVIAERARGADKLVIKHAAMYQRFLDKAKG